MSHKSTMFATTVVALTLLLCPAIAGAQPPLPTCTQITGSSFSGTGAVRKLKADCRTSVTIVVPTGMTLNGNGFTIVAHDPDPSGFKGAVVANAALGDTNVTVTNLIVDTENLAGVCDGGADRLRGIMFDGASGKITNNMVLHINQKAGGGGGCQEGNGIEVRNFDSPGIKTVIVSGNQVYDYQKTGIVINGEVTATVLNNIVGESATQDDLAANGIQIGFGAVATKLDGNQIEGNTWLGFDPELSDFAATAVLLFESGAGTKVLNNLINLIGGNADVGIYVGADSITVSANRVYDWGPDVAGSNLDMDIGISNPGQFNGGIDNTFTKNKVRCYQQPYDNVTGPSNTVLACTDPTSTPAPAIAAASGESVPARPASPFQP